MHISLVESVRKEQVQQAALRLHTIQRLPCPAAPLRLSTRSSPHLHIHQGGRRVGRCTGTKPKRNLFAGRTFHLTHTASSWSPVSAQTNVLERMPKLAQRAEHTALDEVVVRPRGNELGGAEQWPWHDVFA